MTENLESAIKEEMSRLPKEWAEAIGSSGWIKTTDEIAKKYLTLEDEINNLAVEVFLVLIGLEEVEVFAENIEDNVGTSRKESQKIAQEIVERVFIPVSKLAEEKIETRARAAETSWHENVNFVLSGGDYSTLLQKDAPPQKEK